MNLAQVLKNHKEWVETSIGEKADLRYANLRSADLRSADLRYANLRSADLRSADLSYANLSGSFGLPSSIEWMKINLDRMDDGYIAYKSFGSQFPPALTWEIEPGREIFEVVNPLPTLDCACGVNVSTLKWQGTNTGIWKVLIKWEWLPSVVVPYNTDGKFRCERVLLLERVN